MPVRRFKGACSLPFALPTKVLVTAPRLNGLAAVCCISVHDSSSECVGHLVWYGGNSPWMREHREAAYLRRPAGLPLTAAVDARGALWLSSLARALWPAMPSGDGGSGRTVPGNRGDHVVAAVGDGESGGTQNGLVTATDAVVEVGSFRRWCAIGLAAAKPVPGSGACARRRPYNPPLYARGGGDGWMGEVRD